MQLISTAAARAGKNIVVSNNLRVLFIVLYNVKEAINLHFVFAKLAAKAIYCFICDYMGLLYQNNYYNLEVLRIIP